MARKLSAPPRAGLGPPRHHAPPGPGVVRFGILDDDSGFVGVVCKRLAAIGWEARELPRAPAVEALVELRLGALVVDPRLVGDEARWSYLGQLCATLPGLVVIVCTARSSVAERVRGLRLGVDDWLTKPCHPEELIARAEAALRRRRRAEPRRETPVLLHGELEVRPERFDAFVGGNGLDLTRREFELLSLLAGAAGQVLEREEIYQRVWGYAMARGDRSVDVFVRKLRGKLERRSPAWRYIHTQFGSGYRFAPEPASETGALEE